MLVTGPRIVKINFNMNLPSSDKAKVFFNLLLSSRSIIMNYTNASSVRSQSAEGSTNFGRISQASKSLQGPGKGGGMNLS